MALQLQVWICLFTFTVKVHSDGLLFALQILNSSISTLVHLLYWSLDAIVSYFCHRMQFTCNTVFVSELAIHCIQSLAIDCLAIHVQCSLNFLPLSWCVGHSACPSYSWSTCFEKRGNCLLRSLSLSLSLSPSCNESVSHYYNSCPAIVTRCPNVDCSLIHLYIVCIFHMPELRTLGVLVLNSSSLHSSPSPLAHDLFFSCPTFTTHSNAIHFPFLSPRPLYVHKFSTWNKQPSTIECALRVPAYDSTVKDAIEIHLFRCPMQIIPTALFLSLSPCCCWWTLQVNAIEWCNCVRRKWS